MHETDGKALIEKYRKADHDIDPIFLNRWSPRSFLDKEVPEDKLFSIVEAARWAPSSMNKQPWRFILARTKEDRERFHAFIMDGNLKWCKTAPAYMLIISEKNGPTHAFDTGTAWGYLALQAAHHGLITHAMGGFHKDKAREMLQIPEDYDLHAVVAIGYQGEKLTLPEDIQEREKPSDRRALTETVIEGTFK
ncbi:nitroreductase family protein [Aquibacillus koreensis]|uniref:Nitroreductase family protein n=1 Tax=Aquibacillus koreensis TaxID=279446 RepID=A0A9X4AIV8_9BACI|nr:nitroreductase family protein [Aquibacillus koreensis]MCT2534616.1 nitroreductase family protein [Aquibacillus koreensis]MDC3419800.1 nitroreductase family protein [Aquibacillus koreensis]